MFSKSNKRILSDDQIRGLRHMYFYKSYSGKRLAEEFGISRSLVQAIVEYRNGYKNVKDDIPESVKMQRKSARQINPNKSRTSYYYQPKEDKVSKEEIHFNKLKESKSHSLVLHNFDAYPLMEYLKDNRISYTFEVMPAHTTSTKVILL